MPGKMGDDDEFPELDGHGYDMRTELRKRAILLA